MKICRQINYRCLKCIVTSSEAGAKNLLTASELARYTAGALIIVSF